MAYNPFEYDVSKLAPVTQQTYNLPSSGGLNWQSIANVLQTKRPTYTETAFPAVLPFLQPGQDPYLQEAINSIVAMGKESKARTMSDVTTEMAKRGITGSSIEAGTLGETSRQQELSMQSYINQLLYQDATTQRQNLVNFLTQAYGIDVQTANTLAESLAQLMGQELGRQTDIDVAKLGVKAAEASQPSFWEQIIPSVITGGAYLLK